MLVISAITQETLTVRVSPSDEAPLMKVRSFIMGERCHRCCDMNCPAQTEPSFRVTTPKYSFADLKAVGTVL